MKQAILFCIAFIAAQFVTGQDQRNPAFHTFLGVDVDNTSIKRDALFINGVYKGYGAEKAGLQRGDLLKSINNTSVHTFGELVKTLDRYDAGDQVEVTYIRNNATQKVTARLGEYPEFLKYNSMAWLQKLRRQGVEGEVSVATLGIGVDSEWEHYAVRITGFEDDSPAAAAGLQTDDIIMKMDNYEFATIEELRYYLSKYKPGDKVTLTVSRDGKIRSVKVELGERRIRLDETKYKEKKKPT